MATARGAWCSTGSCRPWGTATGDSPAGGRPCAPFRLGRSGPLLKSLLFSALATTAFYLFFKCPISVFIERSTTQFFSGNGMDRPQKIAHSISESLSRAPRASFPRRCQSPGVLSSRVTSHVQPLGLGSAPRSWAGSRAAPVGMRQRMLRGGSLALSTAQTLNLLVNEPASL